MIDLNGEQVKCDDCGQLKPNEGVKWDSKQRKKLCSDCWPKEQLEPETV